MKYYVQNEHTLQRIAMSTTYQFIKLCMYSTYTYTYSYI